MPVPHSDGTVIWHWPQRRAAAVLYIIRYREMRVRFTMRKAWSCDRKGAGCGRKAVGLLRRRVGMEVQRGCLTCKMSAVFTPPMGFPHDLCAIRWAKWPLSCSSLSSFFDILRFVFGVLTPGFPVSAWLFCGALPFVFWCVVV